jgi:hypothetical protein
VQYALQRRHDEREGKAPPFIVMIMVRFLAASGASSLLDRTEQEWREAFGRKRSNAVALLAWSRRQVTDLAEGGGWDAEYPRDAWQMHRLGFAGRNVLDFSRIPQQQLRDLVKRWIRWRLVTGLGLEAGGVRPLRVLTRFAVFLRERGIDGAGGISRAVLEGYLADLHAAMAGRPEHGAHVSVIGLFLSAVAARSAGCGKRQKPPAPPAASPPPSGPPMRRCGPGSPPPSTATGSSPTTTPGSAANSPAHSATSGRHGPEQVTIQRSKTAAIRPRASHRRHRPRQDAAGHSPG